jgi:polysaccharide export outer membrane protein
MPVFVSRFPAACLVLCASLLGAARPSVALSQSAPAPSRAVSQQVEGVQVGDRIIITVLGETQLSDTFTVGAEQVLMLPLVGRVSVAGVPRDELVPHLTRELGRFMKDPVVTARVLILFGVHGEVARPGFYHMPADAIMSDVLEAAGGLTKEALLNKARLMRNGKEIWTARQVEDAIATGRTLQQAGVHAGDQLQIPRREDGGSVYETVRTVALVLTIPITIYTLTRIFE